MKESIGHVTLDVLRQALADTGCDRTPPALSCTNSQRSAASAAKTVPAVRDALHRLGDTAPPELAEVGRLRLAHPNMPMAELGRLANPALTKDTVAGRLRRLIQAASRVDQPRRGR